ncbi:hypothetical protein ACI78T_19100 [Blastococcus sp. SYSU D00922]
MGRLRGLLRHPAGGALVAQGTSAVAGLALQVAAARELGAAGLAVFALGYGALLLATAVSSGMVGSSLTILDRHEPRIRAGLHAWTVIVALVIGVAGVLAAVVSGVVPGWSAPLVGLACAAFIVEDTLRRLLMATRRFWSLPTVDITNVVLAIGTLVVLEMTGELTMTSFVVAVLVSQTGAGIIAWWCVPAGERPRGPWRRPALRGVAGFGVWSALTQMIRPAALSLLRIALIAVVGAAAYGAVEIARVYTAPTLLLVTGVGSFLLPHFVSLRHRDLSESLRFADRTVVALVLGAAVLGAAGVLLLPWLGPLMTGSSYDVPVAAVVAWTGYAMTAGALLPYGSMGMVHGGQRRVMAMRVSELGSLVLAVLCALWIEDGALWSPLALAVGPAVAAYVLRRSLLVPIVRRQESAVEPATA